MSISARIGSYLNRNNLIYSILGILVAVGIGSLLVSEEVLEEEAVSAPDPLVTVTTPSAYTGGQSLSLIGTARAFTEANLTAERSGRITSVNARLGQEVIAGQVIATMENAAERAAVLQAEGVYDAAVANAAQSGVSLEQANTTMRSAKNGAVSTFKSAYTTVNGVVLNTIDDFFSTPNATVPGLKIDGRGFTSELNAERVAYQSILPTWQARANSISPESDLETELAYAEDVTQRTIDLIDTFIVIFNQQGASSRYSDAELTAFSNTFNNIRANLISVQSSIDGARTSLENAADGIRRAELSASGSVNSAADAQVKQALGSLRAAQANLEKTIIRTPISGTVNTLTVRTGDFLNSFASIATIANNDALEIVTYISDDERALLNEGDTVSIEEEFEGQVTEIAPAVDPETRKIEVRIATENIDIQNGDTVRVQKEIEAAATTEVIVPIAAVKFQVEDGLVFLVEDGALVARSVTIGDIRGDSVEILEGLEMTDEFVLDVRGLQAGTAVEVSRVE